MVRNNPVGSAISLPCRKAGFDIDVALLVHLRERAKAKCVESKNSAQRLKKFKDDAKPTSIYIYRRDHCGLIYSGKVCVFLS